MIKILISVFVLTLTLVYSDLAKSEPSTVQADTCLSALSRVCRDGDTFWATTELKKFYSLSNGKIYSCRISHKKGTSLYKISHPGGPSEFRAVMVSDIGGVVIEQPHELQPVEDEGARFALCNISTADEDKESLKFHIGRVAVRCNEQLKREPTLKARHSSAFATCQENGFLKEYPQEPSATTAPATKSAVPVKK